MMGLHLDIYGQIAGAPGDLRLGAVVTMNGETLGRVVEIKEQSIAGEPLCTLVSMETQQMGTLFPIQGYPIQFGGMVSMVFKTEEPKPVRNRYTMAVGRAR